MKKVFLSFLTLFSIFIITGCGTKELTEQEKLDKILKEKNYIVLDVRYDYEYSEGHVVNSINIPYDQIDENVDLDKNKPILVYCKSGKRSSIAYDKLKELGYEVYNLGAYKDVTLEKE